MATISFGANFLFGGSGLAEVSMITLPTISVPAIDVTPLSGANYYRKFTPGFINPGELSVETYWNSSDYSKVFGWLRQTAAVTLSAPSGSSSTLGGSGMITNMTGPSHSTNDEASKFSFTVQATGPWTLT